eukprot:7673779-Prorocentrum_lima.AAC.1
MPTQCGAASGHRTLPAWLRARPAAGRCAASRGAPGCCASSAPRSCIRPRPATGPLAQACRT